MLLPNPYKLLSNPKHQDVREQGGREGGEE
jgi:hypothetical protein